MPTPGGAAAGTTAAVVGQPFTLQWEPGKTGQTALNIGSNVKRAGGNLAAERRTEESERRFVSLRVSTRGLRTIEKKGVDKVIAELRAQGVEV